MSLFAEPAGAAAPARDDRFAFYGFGTVLVALAFWVSGGHALFSGHAAAPAATLSDVAWQVTMQGSRPALHVQGTVRNAGASAITAEPVRVTVRQSDGRRTTFRLGEAGFDLAPGEEFVVRGRLDIASSDVASVVIDLAD